ncbi:hypothetical protein AB1Y20_002304 [Prymnesium parvum]|uniref:LamG-like jellyroll fold domain-containing protein n=1 Tax=Prymnesium parvum TaxID=97485 RepID=A0AB34JBC9_PRYPA
MEVVPKGRHGRREPRWLDELILQTIALSVDGSRGLAKLACVCAPLRAAARGVAATQLQQLLHRLQTALPSLALDDESPVVTLARWEAWAASNVLWFQANLQTLTMARFGGSCQRAVRAWADMSGGRHDAAAVANKSLPVYNECAINGHGALEFSGQSVLHTQAFGKPLPQPITIVVVARARGDTTIVDSLGSNSGRFELCHGYPSATSAVAGPPQVVITADGRGVDSPSKLLRGATRGTGLWHVYTAIFDGPRSELFVDGRCEGSGKNIGNGCLDGLSMGCDHSGVFHLKGSIAELRLFNRHMDPAERSQLEAALALRYGLSHASVSRVHV